MAKASSPVRLEKDLMASAKTEGGRFHRSATEQVEYWADLGRNVSKVIDPDVILKIAAGLVRVRVEEVTAPVVDPDDVFASLDADRASGRLSAAVTTSAVKYQASTTHPGQLERISADGRIDIGQFANGVFVPAPGAEH